MTILKTKLPYYFYDLSSTLPDGRPRWVDNFADNAPGIYQPGRDNNPAFLYERANRNTAYSMWQAAFTRDDGHGNLRPAFSPKQMKWQAIRVLSFKHNESSKNDWWEHYQDALFRVFMQPETTYDDVTGEYKQWYLLSPEDGYLVNKYELEKNGPSVKPRNYNGHERYLSEDWRLRQARFIPTECCHHLRNETTAGELSSEL